MRLTKGEAYDVTALEGRFTRWSTATGEYPGARVYDYFDPEGRYLGADVDGIEPLFAAEEDR